MGDYPKFPWIREAWKYLFYAFYEHFLDSMLKAALCLDFQSFYTLNLSVNVDKPAPLISRKIDTIINHTSLYEMLPER
jgi:hypothetical protein